MKAINLNLETIQKYTQHYINKLSIIMKQQLRVFLTLLLCTVASVGWGQTNTYKLVKVTSVEKNGLYVFEQDGYVIINSIVSGALKTTNNYLSTGLTGTESYVWTLKNATNGFYISSTKKSSTCITNTSGSNMSFAAETKCSVWTFNFQNDGTFVIQNTKNDDRFLGYTSTTSHEYKTYADSNLDKPYYPHAIVVYKLVPSVSVSISDAGLATFSSVKALDFTNCEEVSAYKAKVEGSQVTLTKVDVVPAETGVLLRSMTGGAVKAAIPVATSAAAIDDNAFVPVLETIESLASVTDGCVNYILSKNGDVTGFYKANNKNVAAGKAYLRVEANKAKDGLTIGYADETDGIRLMENGKLAMENAAIYNLSGQRVNKAQKGIYIVNGKKIVMK